MQRINLVEQKSALVEKIDELQADSVKIANTLVANLQKHTGSNSTQQSSNNSQNNSANANILGGINSQAASQAASSAINAASNLFGKKKWW